MNPDIEDYLLEEARERDQMKAGTYKICPNCGKKYTPDLDRQHPEQKIQDEFPNATPAQREQHITGICSDKCWDEFLGVTG